MVAEWARWRTAPTSNRGTPLTVICGSLNFGQLEACATGIGIVAPLIGGVVVHELPFLRIPFERLTAQLFAVQICNVA